MSFILQGIWFDKVAEEAPTPSSIKTWTTGRSPKEMRKRHLTIKENLDRVSPKIDVMTMADQIVVLNGGRIEHTGTPAELYRQPKTPFVAGFIGSPQMNFIKGAFARSKGAEVIGMRPEDIGLSANGGQWKGRIRHSEFLGVGNAGLCRCRRARSHYVKDPGEMTIAQGETVFLNLDLAKAHAFKSGQFRQHPSGN